jgi:hypothetical protein
MDNIFYKCVDLLMYMASIFGITYEEINVLVFCFIWPAVTIFLIYKAYFNKNGK